MWLPIDIFAFLLLLQTHALQFKNSDKFYLTSLFKDDKNVWCFYNCMYYTIKCIPGREEILFCHVLNEKLILCFNLHIRLLEKFPTD